MVPRAPAEDPAIAKEANFSLRFFLAHSTAKLVLAKPFCGFPFRVLFVMKAPPSQYAGATKVKSRNLLSARPSVTPEPNPALSRPSFKDLLHNSALVRLPFQQAPPPGK